MNFQVGVKWQTFWTIAHSIMVHGRVSYKYVHFELLYKINHILPVIPTKNLVNKDVEPTTPQKISTGTKPSVSNLPVLFYQCVVQKATAHVDTKALNMRRKPQ